MPAPEGNRFGSLIQPGVYVKGRLHCFLLLQDIWLFPLLNVSNHKLPQQGPESYVKGFFPVVFLRWITVNRSIGSTQRETYEKKNQRVVLDCVEYLLFCLENEDRHIFWTDRGLC